MCFDSPKVVAIYRTCDGQSFGKRVGNFPNVTQPGPFADHTFRNGGFLQFCQWYPAIIIEMTAYSHVEEDHAN